MKSCTKAREVGEKQHVSNVGALAAFDRSQRIPELDGIRGFAVLLVIIYHYSGYYLPQNKILFYLLLPTRLMWSGVDLFLVLSGLLIGGILLDHRESPNYYKAFYARRIHRIFPLYYIMVALLAIGATVNPTSPLFKGSLPFWAFLLFAQNFFGNFTRAPIWIVVTWSLAVEEQFYTLFPFILRKCSDKALLISMIICVLGAPFLRLSLIMHGWGFGQVYPMLPCRADALALGVIGALILRSNQAQSWIRKRAPILYLFLLLLLAMLPTILKWTTYWYVGTVGYSIFDITCFLLIIMLLLAPLRLLKAWFCNPSLRWLGRVSYCVYLIHVPVIYGVFNALGLGFEPKITGPITVAWTMAAVALTFAIAQMSWNFLENPLVRRAHRYYRY